MMTQVLIYNLGGQEVLGRVSVKHAITMLHRKVARIREAVEGQKFGPYDRPAAVELLQYVYAKWKYSTTRKVRVSKTNVLRRDRWTCAYCGKRADTIDHVTPRCQGGTTSWMNCVAACGKCNGKKDGRTPGQARMPLRFDPFVPSVRDLLVAT